MGTNFKEQNTKTEVETTTIGWATKCLSLPYVSALQNCTHVKAQESICFVVNTPPPPLAREAEQSRGNKGTCVVKIAFPDLDRRTTLLEDGQF